MRNRHPTGSRSVPYLILLRGGFALRGTLSRPAGGLLHRPFTVFGARAIASVRLSARFGSVARAFVRLFSVALSIAGDYLLPSAFDKRILRPAESGLSSVLADSDRSLARRFRRKFQRAVPRLRRGRGCDRTSCRQQSTEACPPRRSSHLHQQADRRSGAARDDSRHRRHRS